MNFDELSKKIMEAPVGNVRLTDVKKGSTYQITFDDKNRVYLTDAKKNRTPVSPNALAALRVVTDPVKAATAKTTRDARTHEDYNQLQKLLLAENGIKLDANTKFNVVHQLQILDTNQDTDTPIYRNECYRGYPAYIKETRKIAASANANDDEATVAARGAAYTAASEALRATGLKPGIQHNETTWMMMPVFTITT